MNGLKYLIYAVGMIVIYTMINNYDKKHIKLSNGTADNYVVITPPILKKVYMLMFAVGMILYGDFLILYLKKEAGVTKGHLRFALIFAAIGLFVAFLSCKWKIEVSKDKIKISPLFKKTVILDISEIEKVKIGSKCELIIYCRGRKITTVDSLCVNFDKLCDTLLKDDKL